MSTVRSQVIGITPGYRESMLAREEAKKFEERIFARRKTWRILPPENITLMTSAGLILSVPHEIGRHMLMHRAAAIIERDVIVDAVIEGTIEQFLEGSTAW